MRIYVGNLSYQTDEKGLRNFFQACGNIVDAIVIIDREKKRSKGFGFVAFDDSAAVDKALKLSGQELDGRTIRIARAEQRQSGDHHRRRG